MDYNKLYAEGEQCRVNNQAETAIEKYRAALKIGGQHDRAIQQMMGVCYNVLGLPEEALKCFDEALNGAAGAERGNILRDQGYAYTLAQTYDEALRSYKESLRLLSIIDEPDSYAATVGYGRTEIAKESLEDALRHLLIADAILRQTGNLRIELYNALWLAHTYILNRQANEGRQVAHRALKLAGQYGSPDHQARAQFYIDNADDPQRARNYKEHIKASSQQKQSNDPVLF